MITVYLRTGELAEVNAESIENRGWDLADGSTVNSLVCLDSEGDVVGQFLLDQVSGWAFTEEDDIFAFDEDEEE